LAQTHNRLDAFLEPSSTGTIIALSIIFFTASHFIKSKKELDLTTYFLIASFAILAFMSLFGARFVKVVPGLLPKMLVPTGNPFRFDSL
jgi:hypothetical protein